MTKELAADPHATAMVVHAMRIIARDTLAQSLDRAPLRVDPSAMAPLLPHVAQPEQSSAFTRLATRQARSQFVIGPVGTWSPYQAALLPADALLGPATRVLARLHDMLRRRAYQNGAALLLPALGSTAWRGLGFRREVALALRRHLRNRVLMSPPMPATVVLDDAFWWFLLARADSTPAFSMACKNQWNRASASDGWAGFWEQLLLRGLAQDATEGDAIVASLPLVAAGRDALKKDARDDPAAARHGWREAAPAWTEYYLEGQI